MKAYEELARAGFARYRAQVLALGVPNAVAAALAPDERFNHDRAFLAFAFLLRDAFPTVSAQHLQAIADATYCGARAALDLDQLLDGGRGLRNQTAWLVVQHFQMAQRHLARVFGDEHPFWPAYNELVREHCERCGDEAALTAAAPPDAEQFKAIAMGKATLVRLPVLALAHASGCLDLVEPMNQVLSLEQVAMQWRDDVCDIAEDLAAGQITLVTQRLRTWCAEECVDLPADPERVKMTMHEGGISLRMFEDIERVLAEVVDLARKVMPAGYMGFLGMQVERNRRALEGMRSLMVPA